MRHDKDSRHDETDEAEGPRMAMAVEDDKELALDQAAALEAARVASYPPTVREQMIKLLLLSWYHRGALDAVEQVKARIGGRP